ncbi:hypothetical protein BH20GEM1_BH20GEM1_14120 [soil metagenome]
MSRSIRVYFDFISPYSYLALTQLAAYGARYRVAWEPAHPFRSLDALRVATLFGDDPRALELAVALASACWGEGRDLTDWNVLAEIVGRVGLGSPAAAGSAADLAALASEPEVKQALQQRTAAAIEAGVFGVPTFELEGELFWGHDRLEHLAARLEGRLPDLAAPAGILEARPRAADRPSAPILRETTAG